MKIPYTSFEITNPLRKKEPQVQAEERPTITPRPSQIDAEGIFRGSVEDLKKESEHLLSRIKTLDIGSEISQLARALDSQEISIPQNLQEFKFVLSDKGEARQGNNTTETKNALDMVAYEMSTQLGRAGRSGESVRFIADFQDIEYSAKYAQEDPSIIGTEDAANTFSKLANAHPVTRKEQDSIITTILNKANSDIQSADGEGEVNSYIPGSTSPSPENGKNDYTSVISRLTQGQSAQAQEAASKLIQNVQDKTSTQTPAVSTAASAPVIEEDSIEEASEQVPEALKLNENDVPETNLEPVQIEEFVSPKVELVEYDPTKLAQQPDVEIIQNYSPADFEAPVKEAPVLQPGLELVQARQSIANLIAFKADPRNRPAQSTEELVDKVLTDADHAEFAETSEASLDAADQAEIDLIQTSHDNARAKEAPVYESYEGSLDDFNYQQKLIRQANRNLANPNSEPDGSQKKNLI